MQPFIEYKLYSMLGSFFRECQVRKVSNRVSFLADNLPVWTIITVCLRNSVLEDWGWSFDIVSRA